MDRVETTGSRSLTTLVRGISPCMFLIRAPQRNSRLYPGASDLAYGACDLISERGGQPPEYDPPRVIEVRDAVREDAPAACEVIRRSISELCEADHRNDPEILRRWLANKTPEIVASWIVQPGNSVLVAVETPARLQWAPSPIRVRSCSTMYRRTQGFVVSVERCSLRSKQERSNEALIDARCLAPKRLIAFTGLPGISRTALHRGNSGPRRAIRCRSA